MRLARKGISWRGMASVARFIRKFMLGNHDVARCDFVGRQPRLKRHLSGWLPDNAYDFASLRSYVL